MMHLNSIFYINPFSRIRANILLTGPNNSIISSLLHHIAAHPDVLPITNKGVKIGVGIPKKLYAEAI